MCTYCERIMVIVCAGDEPDGQLLIRQPDKNARKVEASNPIYEGPTYETTPGESFKPLISLNESRPTTPSAELTPHYVDTPPTLPPPRGGERVNTRGSSEPVDEIDAIKASIKQAQLQLPALGQTGDEEYMIMGPKHCTSKSKDVIGSKEGPKKTGGDEDFVTDAEEKYVTLDTLR